MHYSLNREEAKNGRAVITGTFENKVNLEEYFGDDTNIYFSGEGEIENNIIYIPETDTARNLTIQEKVDRGIIKLRENEYIENGEIKQREEKLTELQQKEIELENLKNEINNVVDELERAKNYELHTRYTIHDLELLKQKEFNLSLEIAMLINKEK